MLQLMEKLIKSTYLTWPEFSQAIKDVSEEDIDTVVQEESRIMMLEWDTKANHPSVPHCTTLCWLQWV